MFCEIYLFDAPYHIDRAYDYSLEFSVGLGTIVKVPFGKANRLRLGVITKVKDCSLGANIKPVHSVVSDRFSFTEDMLGLCLFLKEYTLCTFGEAARAVLPPGALSEHLNVKYRKICSLAKSAGEVQELLLTKGRGGIRSDGQRKILEHLLTISRIDVDELRDLLGVTLANISALAEKGILKIEAEVHQH